MDNTAKYLIISPQSFWYSINILITKPHVINKRLWGYKNIIKVSCLAKNNEWESLMQSVKINDVNNIQEFMYDLIKEAKLQPVENVLPNSHNIVEFILIELLPKNYSECHAYQLICLKTYLQSVTFYDVTPNNLNQNLCPNFNYTLELQNGEINVIDETNKSYQWLMRKLLPQVLKWACEHLNSITPQSIIVNESLSLVPKAEYYKKYNELKIKYGKELVKIWPECTDPAKFVFEDIAIATYLLLLWTDKCNGKTKSIKFLDVGCGNGLLVYILTNEGHDGLGVDIRKRKIWNMFDDNIKLKEMTITPTNIDLFPDMDWIIGNHSDELTPWIPIMAAKSSYKCNFFLLPCCAYNLDGTKYQRQNSSKSQYNEYLEFINKLCESCGFNMEADRLKIPSTKRLCLIGRSRKYMEYEHDEFITKILRFCLNKNESNSNLNILNFKARDVVEKVKNCTQIDKTVIEKIIENITKFLLDGCDFKNEWSAGKEVYIHELIPVISPKALKVLKSECGGLQTLLKNNNHIFKVQNGKVQLKYPKTVEEAYNMIQKQNKIKSSIRVQVKHCWLHNNHPQGCPLTATNCSYLHFPS